MTTTLSEGVKVPDVGSVNWAGDLEINWNLLNGALANLSGNVKLDRDNTWTGEQSFTLPIIGSITGTASKAIADEDGTSIKTGYVNVAGNQTVSGDKTWTGEQTFSQTIQGNAATASAFDTAKSITLTGAVTGTVSGTNSWEIATALKTGSAATGGTVTNPYFKIASWEVAPNDYFGTILQIQNKYYPYQIATLTIGLRTKTDATFQKGYSLLNNAIGIQSSAFILCYKEVTGKVLCELYYYTTTSFNGIRFSVISEGTRNDSSVFNTMVVYQNPAGIAALPSDYTAIQTSIGTYSQDFIPYATNTYSLGSSSYQWSSVYAQSYYYNGTQWGLDKENVWSGYNTYTNVLLTLKHTALEAGVLPASNQTRRYRFTDKNNTDLGWLQHRVNTSGDSYLEILSTNKFSNGQFSPQGSDVANSLIVGVHSDGKRYAQIMSDFYPAYTNPNCNLGTSTNQWKTLNGNNPGALSLPDASNSVNIDTTNWDLTGATSQSYTPAVPGWLFVSIQNIAGNYLSIVGGRGAVSMDGTGVQAGLRAMLPVVANESVGITVKTGYIFAARFYPMLGNV